MPDVTSTGQPAERLDSWKEIARYLNRDESTVQRWEKREGMPVHRHLHAKRGSVYAYRAELDQWWHGRRRQLEAKTTTDAEMASPAQASPSLPPPESGLASVRRRRRWWVGTGAALVGAICLGLLASGWLPRPQRASQVGNAAIVRLTSTSGLNIDPALSTDGASLAYASDRGGTGNLDIWVQPTGEEHPIRVTSDPGDEVEPSFSPIGESIVFAKGEGGGIYSVGAGGGTPHRLVAAARARAPRFSPDGRWVTYWTGLPVGVAPIGALFVVPAGGGSPRPVAPDFAHARYGTWSPHGEKILFVGARQHDPSGLSLDWFVVGVSGGEPVATGALRVLRQAGVHGVPIPAAWSADGTVVFANNDDGASNVWQLAISPETGLAAGAPVRLTFGTAVERSPAISASGRVAFTSLVENVDIWRLPLDAETGLVGGAMERVTDNAATDVLMNVSDDGRTMAFMSSRTGQREVWITDLSTGRDRQLTLPGARSAHVSRDGSRLAIDRASETRGIDLVPTTGGASTPLCDGCATGDWSPDGRHMVVHRGLPSRLLMRDLESGRETELAAHPTWNLFRPRFSPDGRWIVFHTTNSPSLRQVYAVPAFQDAAVPLEAWIPIVPDFGVHPNWAPDGAGIYHFSIRDGLFCVWLQPLDLSTKRPVGKAQAVEHFHKAGLRAATGAGVTNHVAAGYLYVTLTSAAANIWMLER